MILIIGLASYNLWIGTELRGFGGKAPGTQRDMLNIRLNNVIQSQVVTKSTLLRVQLYSEK